MNGNIRAALLLNISNFTRGLQQARRQLDATARQFRTTFRDAYRDIDRTTRSTQELYRGMEEVNRIVGGILISQAFYQGAAAIRNATGELFTFMGEMEKSQIAMEYFLGTPERASGFIDSMKDFAATTAFDTQQALTLSRRMMGAGFEPESLRHVMTILNDAAATTGATRDQMDRIVLAMTQMRTNGKIMGQEMRQFAEAGIPIYDILSEKLGILKEDLMRVGDLKIDGDLGVMAILQGLEENYKGAAERIALTMPGMMETIRDDTLFLSEELFQGLYQHLKGYVRTVRDALEEARDIYMNHGMGGVFERFIPEELQTSVRIILASFQSLIDSMRRLHEVMGPSLGLLFKALTTGFATIIPIIAKVVEIVTRFIKAIYDATPAVRILIASIMGLMVANVAAKAVTMLWMVITRGFIASAVAQAVNLLTAAVRTLFIVITRNPIVGVIMLISGALLSVALSSQKVTAWLTQVMNKLSEFFGLNYKSIFQPEERDDSKWLDEFNQQLEDIGKDLTGTGEKAKEAGDKVKKNFVASFDEVFQVPDQLDELQDSLDGLVPDVSSMVPQLPKELFPDIPPIDVDWDFDIPDPPPWFGKVTETEFRFKFTPPDGGTALATAWDVSINYILNALKSLESAFANAAGAIRGWVPQLNPLPHISPIPNAVSDWVGKLSGALDQLPNMIPNWHAFWSTLPYTVEAGMQGLDRLVIDPLKNLVNGINEWSGSLNAGWGAAWEMFWNSPVVSSSSILSVIPTIQDLGSQIKAWLTDLSTSWSAGWASLSGNTIPTLQAIGQAIGINTEAWSVTLTAFTEGAQTIMANGWTLIKALITGDMATVGLIISQGFATIMQGLGIDTDKMFSTINTWMENCKTAIKDGLSALKGFWEEHSTAIMIVLDIALTLILSLFTGGLAGILRGATSWLPKLLKVFQKIGPGVTKAISGMGTWFAKAWDKIPSAAGKIADKIVKAFKDLPDKIWSAIKSIPDKVMDIFSKIKLPSFSTMMDGVKATFQSIGNVVGFANGGIIGKDSIVRVGEGDRREAIIPLQNRDAMQPFADAVAAGVLQAMPSNYNDSNNEQQPIMYVGTLIADDRSLRELERKMKVIRMQENAGGR